MKRTGRLRRVLLWIGLSACLLVAAMWLVTLRWQVWYSWDADVPVPPDTRSCGIAEGGVFYQAYHCITLEEHVQGAPGWHIAPSYGDLGFRTPIINTRQYRTEAWFPLWPAMVLATIFTLLVYCCPRRRPAGTCAGCGYDLTGNVSGRSPECGEPVRGASPGAARD